MKKILIILLILIIIFIGACTIKYVLDKNTFIYLD